MKSKVKCIDVERHLDKLWQWDIAEKATDGFKIGNPAAEIKKIGVMWKPKLSYIKRAFEDGCSFLIVHESIAALTQNSSEKTEKDFALPQEAEKFDFLEKNNIVVYRCHDLWDRIKEIGVRDTWQKALFAENKIVADNYPYYVTEIEPCTLEALAKRIVKVTEELGQQSVLLCGDRAQIVSKVATGTGVSVDTIKMKEMGAQVGVITDDYYLHVRHGVLSEEMGMPTITVNHNVAEEWAIENMAEYLKEKFGDIEVKYYKQTCPYETVV